MSGFNYRSALERILDRAAESRSQMGLAKVSRLLTELSHQVRGEDWEAEKWAGFCRALEADGGEVADALGDTIAAVGIAFWPNSIDGFLDRVLGRLGERMEGAEA